MLNINLGFKEIILNHIENPGLKKIKTISTEKDEMVSFYFDNKRLGCMWRTPNENDYDWSAEDSSLLPSLFKIYEDRNLTFGVYFSEGYTIEVWGPPLDTSKGELELYSRISHPSIELSLLAALLEASNHPMWV